MAEKKSYNEPSTKVNKMYENLQGVDTNEANDDRLLHLMMTRNFQAGFKD